MKESVELISPKKVWRTADGDVLMNEMDSVHLQKAYNFSQKSELDAHNRYCMFSKLAEQLREEAESRGLVLKEVDELQPKQYGSFFKNKRKLESVTKINKEQIA